MSDVKTTAFHMCRSRDCELPAQYRAQFRIGIPRQRKPNDDRWDGYWCLPHLMRVLPLKLGELSYADMIVIERMGSL